MHPTHLVIVREVVSVILALVAPDDVEEVVLCQEAVRHVGSKQVGVASGALLVSRPRLERKTKLGG